MFSFFCPVLCIGIILMTIRIRLFDAVDPDPDPDWHQNDADPHADPTPSFTHVGKSDIFLLLVTALPVYYVLSFSSVSNVP
jgi:hypothetical protein